MNGIRIACVLCLMLGGKLISGQTFDLPEDSAAKDWSIWVEALEAGQREKDQIHAYQTSLKFPLPAPKHQSVTEPDVAKALGGALALGGLGLVALFVIHFNRERRKNRNIHLTIHQQELLKRINEELKVGMPKLAQRKTNLMAAMIQLSRPFSFRWTANVDYASVDVSYQEMELIVWTKLKFTIDEIAAEMGLSTSHIYRIRAGLRKKINLQRQQTLDIFLTETALQAH